MNRSNIRQQDLLIFLIILSAGCTGTLRNTNPLLAAPDGGHAGNNGHGGNGAQGGMSGSGGASGSGGTAGTGGAAGTAGTGGAAGTAGTAGASGTGGSAGSADWPPETTDGSYRWYPALDLDRIPFHAGSGPWGAQERIETPAAPAITDGEYVVHSESEWNAMRGPGRRLIVPSGTTIGAVGLDFGDTEIVIEDGARVGTLSLIQGSRFMVRGSRFGTHGTGQVGTINLAGAITDIIIDGLSQNVPSIGTVPNVSVHRVSFTNMRANKDIGILTGTTDVVIAGCNVKPSIEGWALRLERDWRRVIVFRSHLENYSNALLRPSPPYPGQASGAFWIGESTLVNSIQSNANAQGFVIRVSPSNPDANGSVDSVFVEDCRIHAQGGGNAVPELGPSTGICKFYRHTGGLVISDRWDPVVWDTRQGSGEVWEFNTTVVPANGNPVPAWDDRNNSGDPATLPN